MASDGTSNRVYVRHPDHGWVPGRLLSHSDDGALTVTVSVRLYSDENYMQSDGDGPNKHARGTEDMVVDLSEYEEFGRKLPLQNVDAEGKLTEVEDMVDLPFLHEAAILYNLKSRHLRGVPYTRTGDIVIAVNPYQWIDGLYSDDMRDLYAERLIWNVPNDTDAKAGVEPHVYETSALSYHDLCVHGSDQSILVSGESGAGKTETVKILMSHLASVQGGGMSGSGGGGGGGGGGEECTSPIVQRVLDSNPLLEAFGNAKTVRNDNSSRFGKYIRLQFDAEDPSHAAFAGRSVPAASMAGSTCEVYLLEKSRVVGHSDGERTYHIFYQLIAAPAEERLKIWDELAWDDVDNECFAFVGYTDTHVIEGKTDAQRWGDTVEALGIVGVSGETFLTLMRAICAVLQLGNLVFGPDPSDDERSVIESGDELDRLAGLMGVEKEDINNALTQRTVTARNEEFKVPLNETKAKDSCDAFAKEIYAKAFHWLVRTINDATSAERNYDGRASADRGGGAGYRIIGLLDIFGFESFEVNRYEQLCINYANEKLQQKFTLDIFRSVQAEYEFEGIELDEVTFSDNSDVLDLIEGRMGLIAVLNEECVRPQGSDEAFVNKVNAVNRDSDCLIKDNFFRAYEFGIQHYAGPVVYDATNFVTKNMDTIPVDLVECASKSTNDIIRKELGEGGGSEELSAQGGGGGSGGGGGPGSGGRTRPGGRGPRPGGRGPRPGRSRPGGRGGPGGGSGSLVRKGSSIVAHTVWTKFRSQLTALMANIGETRTRYIRCIKPNPEKRPRIMRHLPTIEQLRCAGVVAAVTISRSAFPNRLEHPAALERFACLGRGFVPGTPEEDDIDGQAALRDDADRLLTSILGGMEVEKESGGTARGFVCGKTRTYFRAGVLEHLEAERLRSFGTHAVLIQRTYRGYRERIRYKAARNASVRVQAAARRGAARWRFRRLRAACVLVQCWARCLSAKSEWASLRRHRRATLIQTHWRMAVAMVLRRRSIAAAVKIQARARGARQRPIFRAALAEAIEERKLENKLKALQQRLEEAEARRVEAERKAEESAKAPKVVVYRETEKEGAGKEEEEEAAEKEEEEEEEESAAKKSRAPPQSQPREEEPEPAPAAAGQLTEQQQTLMDESQKMLEYLRKEVFKLRSQNAQLRTDFDLLKENNQRLMDANASAGASFAALNQHAKQLNKTNAKLVAELDRSKRQVHRLNLAQVELKEELRMKQHTYIAEVQSRLNYQKTLTRIVDEVQERCRDVRLVEDVLEINDECESDYPGGGAADTDVTPSRLFQEGDDGGEVNGPDPETPSFSSRFKSFLGY